MPWIELRPEFGPGLGPENRLSPEFDPRPGQEPGAEPWQEGWTIPSATPRTLLATLLHGPRFARRPSAGNNEGRSLTGILRATLVAMLVATPVWVPWRATQAQQPPGSAPGLPAPPPLYLILIDAAHGGPEPGARLTDRLLEKDLTLALSVRLRSVFSAHGMAVATSREADTNPSPDDRAALANRTHPAACLLLHATTSGTGVHLYTAALAPAPAPSPGALHPWATAQAPFLTDSLKLSSDIREALTHAGIPVVLGSVSLQPVDSMSCPAVILEVAPLLARRGKGALALGTPEYETLLVDALDGALEQWRADRPPALRAQR